MGKIKYQGGLTKLITSKLGKKNKNRFARFIEQNLSELRSKSIGKMINLEVVSFSSTYDFNEQVLSILSFLQHVGTPSCWILYSDGSHTVHQIKILESAFEFLKVKIVDLDNFECTPSKCKEVLIPYLVHLLDYAKRYPLGKKLFYYLNHEIVKPTLFLDSDVLFYKRASLFDTLLIEKVNGWYLPDTGLGCLDSRYKDASEFCFHVNSGFFILLKEFEYLEEGLNFLKNLKNDYEYFSEQTVFHILFSYNKFIGLDPGTFILDSADQFDFSYLYPREKMAIRHYTGPVRHKMWQRDWKWQLSYT